MVSIAAHAVEAIQGENVQKIVENRVFFKITALVTTKCGVFWEHIREVVAALKEFGRPTHPLRENGAFGSFLDVFGHLLPPNLGAKNGQKLPKMTKKWPKNHQNCHFFEEGVSDDQTLLGSQQPP